MTPARAKSFFPWRVKGSVNAIATFHSGGPSASRAFTVYEHLRSVKKSALAPRFPPPERQVRKYSREVICD